MKIVKEYLKELEAKIYEDGGLYKIKFKSDDERWEFKNNKNWQKWLKFEEFEVDVDEDELSNLKQYLKSKQIDNYFKMELIEDQTRV